MIRDFVRTCLRRWRAVDDIQITLARIEAQQEQISMDISKLQAAVAKETTVEQGAVTLLQELAQELKDALAGGDATAVNALADQISSNADALAAAVTANTPAAPAPDPTSGT